jgi:membrane protease YdiL (CAAX protease family)
MNVKNTSAEIQKRIFSGQINRVTTILAVLIRPALFLAVQGLMVLLFILLKVSNPALSITSWWTVYGTLVDLLCLSALYFLIRREGISLFDLISFDKNSVKKDLVIGFGIILLVFPVTIFTGSIIGSFSVYGSLQPNLPPGNPMTRTLPLWAAIYSKTIWWIINASAEETFYQGYALPRVKEIFGKTAPAVIWVGFCWAIQHSFLPFIDLKYSIFAFLLFLPLSIAMQLIYLKVNRLFPLIIGHLGMDLISALSMISIR